RAVVDAELRLIAREIIQRDVTLALLDIIEHRETMAKRARPPSLPESRTCGFSSHSEPIASASPSAQLNGPPFLDVCARRSMSVFLSFGKILKPSGMCVSAAPTFATASIEIAVGTGTCEYGG